MLQTKATAVTLGGTANYRPGRYNTLKNLPGFRILEKKSTHTCSYTSGARWVGGREGLRKECSLLNFQAHPNPL